MNVTRLILILLVFFGLLYYFRGPLAQAPGAFNQLHSPYAESFRKAFYEIITATSSSVIGGSKNYIPGVATSSTYPNTTASTSGTGNNSGTVQNGTTGPTKSSTAGNIDTSVSDATNSGKVELLPVTSNQQEETLSASGIIADTNAERQKAGLPVLRHNIYLTASAEDKLQDMFANQYFEHVSPTGENVSTVVSRDGYDYVVVGENLALGIFAGDDQVVAAWMASPGHKKNILDPRYQDIGVAVGQGMYQGRKQWLIVQHFGKPLSACPSPSTAVKQNITVQSSQLNALEQEVTSAKADVDQSASSGSSTDYSAKVEIYNGLVTDYNAKRDSLKTLLDSYNVSVKTFNACIGSTN